MDFIILKINGTDVSSFPHEDAVRAFLAAQEPIVVEIKRRIVDTNTADNRILQTNTVSIGIQTDICGIIWPDENVIDCPDIDLEEVTLRKCSSDEKLGLTVCYSSGSELDTCTEVYIRDIVPQSVADLDGRLRQGDQILQVNGKDVANKEETECLFAENRKAVTLLVSRCYNKNDEYLEPDDQDVGISTGRTATYQNTVIEQIIQRQSDQLHQSKSETSPKIPAHYIQDKFNLTNSLVRSKLDSINHEISELNDRMQNIQLIKFDRRKECTTPLESETEHIYETIPESVDAEIEPIYCCPYEESQVEQWLITQENCWSPHVNEPPKEKKEKVRSKSLKSNSSGEEHENSSSAYNTGGSSNSNHLTFELACNLDSKQKNVYKSTLVLCPNVQIDEEKTQTCDTCKNQKTTIKKAKVSKPSTIPKANTSVNHVISDTMYTNVANLQQTMLLQQQLFRQTLGRYGTTISTNTTIENQQTSTAQDSNSTILNTGMEWKVKRRPDGTRYIARRPVRNRILKERGMRITEERCGLTTEDDTLSELKIGRYWTKEERKKHLEKSKERRQRQEILQAARSIEENNEVLVQKQTHCVVNKKTTNNLDNAAKKHKSKKMQKESYDNFPTVQDVLIHGNKVVPNQNSKMIGLLSVTTV